jgi:hypothetical protein
LASEEPEQKEATHEKVKEFEQLGLKVSLFCFRELDNGEFEEFRSI